MKTVKWMSVLFLGATAHFGACTPKLPNDCEFLRTCPDASGGASTTDSGDSDGTGGDEGEGGAHSGGTTTSGDGDGDTSGSGGEIIDPCSLCEGDTPVCVDDECVACSETEHGSCSDDQVCSAENTCVECLDNSHCNEPDASVCDLQTNTCTGCEDNEGCSHLEDTAVCDTESKSCVECTVESDDRSSDSDTCGTKVCDPQTLACNTTTQASKDVCAACTADNECLPNLNCIPLFYKPDALPEVPMGGFCMKPYPGCTPPYQAGALHRESLSGAAAADYCGLAENLTTCAAIKDLEDGTLCSDPSECGSANGEGVCDFVNGGAEKQCSYSCTLSSQCVSGSACGGVSGSKYCGG